VFATRYYGDGGLLSNISSDEITQPFANLVVSNAVTTTNVFATRYYGDGGLLSNISSDAITQPFANLVVSNAVTTTNIFATSANIATMNVGYLTVNSAVVYGTSTLNVYGTSNLTNVTVTDTFNVNGSMTANAANATFFFDTFTIPYINTQELNVSSDFNFTGPLATFSNLYVPGNANIEYLSVSNLSVTGNLYVTATNVFASTLILTTALAVTSGGTGTTTSTGTGSVVLSNAPTLTGTTSVATLIASGNITSLSDRRIKKDIKHIEGALDKVTQIGGYTFIRTDESNKDQRQSGVIAQEILKVLPEVVHISEETGYYSVSYGNITALLIEALKEERIERLKLEERIAWLENLLQSHPIK
jgi:hypothetical protein